MPTALRDVRSQGQSGVRRETGKEEMVQVHHAEGETNLSLGAGVVPLTEGNTDGRDNASARTARRGLRHWHVRTLFAREPGDLMDGQRQHACCTGPRREGEEP